MLSTPWLAANGLSVLAVWVRTAVFVMAGKLGFAAEHLHDCFNH
ncbi:hypothetical protein [Piscirickettsia salmonis]|nr:hypothetical protein [Piscirickettsia salmonis]